jgi:mannosyltransferase OCH1-like enzyme
VPTGISNDVLGSVAGHNFWEHVIKNLATYDRNWLVSYITVMYSTGPLFLSVMWVEYLPAFGSKPGYERKEIDRIRVLVKGEEEGDSYGFFNNVQGGSWHGRDVEMMFWMGRHWVIVTIFGFVVGFGVTGGLWWVLKGLVGFWNKRQ